MTRAALPDFTTPDQLASHLGWSERRVREVARNLGACRIMGNRMILTHSDVVVLLRSTKPNISLPDMREWLGADADELIAEADAQQGIEPTGFVYFIKGESDRVKIGYTIDIGRRMHEFRTGTPDTLTLLLSIPGNPLLEVYFHDKFAHRHHQREWYVYSGDIEEFIARRNFGK